MLTINLRTGMLGERDCSRKEIYFFQPSSASIFSSEIAVEKTLLGPTEIRTQNYDSVSKYQKIGTLSVHVSAHGDCTVAKGFNQYSVACKNFKGMMFNS